jgi:hypothetical protein
MRGNEEAGWGGRVGGPVGGPGGGRGGRGGELIRTTEEKAWYSELRTDENNI